MNRRSMIALLAPLLAVTAGRAEEVSRQGAGVALPPGDMTTTNLFNVVAPSKWTYRLDLDSVTEFRLTHSGKEVVITADEIWSALSTN